jgi:hypothetical protein
MLNISPFSMLCYSNKSWIIFEVLMHSTTFSLLCSIKISSVSFVNYGYGAGISFYVLPFVVDYKAYYYVLILWLVLVYTDF